MKNHSFSSILFLILGLIIFPNLRSVAQKAFSISGKVMANGVEVPGASILLSGFKFTAITTNEGEFVIPNLSPGKYDLIVKMLGYNPTSKSIEITDKNVHTVINISESTTTLKEVIIGRDVNREHNMKIFIEHFIGKSENAKLCKILNPDVINFSFDAKNKILYGSASDMIIIENKALGYKVNYLLKEFEVNYSKGIVYYAGLPHFEQLKSRASQINKYNKNRKAAYLGSMTHFYKSAYNNKSHDEGYIVLRRKEVKNPDRQPDSLIDAKIKELRAHAFANAKSTVFQINDSLTYWTKEKRKPEYIGYLDTNPIDINSKITTYSTDLKELKFEDDLFIIYTREKESDLYKSHQISPSRPPKYKNAQVSIVRKLLDSIVIYSNGQLYDTRSVLNEGYWAFFEKIADLVPLDENFN